ncbi:MAG: hypothetical protein HC871_04120 [Rhizobiales bacterium]|nr:hypothetical protein [Hyphomicrobiales bacterium]
MSEAIAADVQGSTSDVLLSSETLGSDEALSRSAQHVASASVAYNEAVRSGASMDASRSVSAKVLIPAIAANPDAARALNDVIVQNGLAGEVQLYENFHGERDQDSFGGSAELAHLYAQAHVASQHVGDGDERSARIQAGLANSFQSAEGFGGYMGDPTMNAGIMSDAPALGARSPTWRPDWLLGRRALRRSSMRWLVQGKALPTRWPRQYRRINPMCSRWKRRNEATSIATIIACWQRLKLRSELLRRSNLMDRSAP